MKKFLFGIIILTFFGCNPKPRALNYGADGCHFCSMTIVDKQHAAQFMTKKGKTYVFDASECMINDLKTVKKSTISLFLVNDYNQPGKLINATKATYLISKSIPSPMGEFLSAFNTKKEAKVAQEKNQGEIFTWEELLLRFN